MSPALWFGDSVVLTPPTKHIPAGTIITMRVNDELVTHRLIAEYNGGWPETKGDANNAADDFSESDLKIAGIVRLRLPWIGYTKLFLDYLLVKF